jgi:hypothetical protein
MTDSYNPQNINLVAEVPAEAVTADANATVGQDDTYLLLTTTGAGANTLTFGTGVDGQRVTVRMVAAVTGTYITVGIDSGEVLFAAAEEMAVFVYDATNDVWRIDGAQTGWQDLTVGFAELGSGASDTFPMTAIVDAWITSAQVTINTAFAGEPNNSLTIGDAGDPNGISLVTVIDGVVAGTMTLAAGLEAGQFNATFTPLLTFTATELDDVTDGNLTVRIHYKRFGTV